MNIDFFALIELILADALLKHGYCIGVPDFTPGPTEQTKGNLKCAEQMTYALAEAGVIRALYAARESHEKLDGALTEVSLYHSNGDADG